MKSTVSQGLPLAKNKKGEPALCLVTGATGYIGSHTWLALLDAGFEIPGVTHLKSALEVLKQEGIDVEGWPKA